jgi:HPt (histidine-containing phosphotransfer) domain-containing protein
MDVHMPELDGLETTRRIRAEWPHHEQPGIIALSANMSHEEQQHYLAMGMDGCLDKSARLQEIAAVLGRYATRSRQPSRQTSAAPTASQASGARQETRPAVQRSRSPIDMRVIEHLQEVLGSDSQAQLAELITIFLSHTGHFFSELEQASSQGRLDTLQHIAHTLKSSSANLGAIRLSRLCRELELVCKSNDVAGAASSVAYICEELRLVHEALAAVRDT